MINLFKIFNNHKIHFINFLVHLIMNYKKNNLLSTLNYMILKN